VKKILILMMVVICSTELKAKNIYGTEVNLVAIDGYAEICESSRSFWSQVRRILPKGNHLLDCYVKASVAEKAYFPVNYQLLSVSTPVHLIQIKVSASRFKSEMRTVKEDVLATYQQSDLNEKESESSSSQTEKSSEGSAESTKLDNVDFKTESETVLSWVESSIMEVDGKTQTTAMYKAYLLINEKVIFLLANSTPDQSLSDFENQASEWAQSIIDVNK
jgi:hypothetical protein